MVSDEANKELTKEVSEEEIKQAMFSIGADKAPGPDGFITAFYQHHWDLVKEDVITEVN